MRVAGHFLTVNFSTRQTLPTCACQTRSMHVFRGKRKRTAGQERAWQCAAPSTPATRVSHTSRTTTPDTRTGSVRAAASLTCFSSGVPYHAPLSAQTHAHYVGGRHRTKSARLVSAILYSFCLTRPAICVVSAPTMPTRNKATRSNRNAAQGQPCAQRRKPQGDVLQGKKNAHARASSLPSLANAPAKSDSTAPRASCADEARATGSGRRARKKRKGTPAPRT